MAEELELKYYVLQRWLKEPSAEHNVWTLASRVGLGDALIMRVMSELLRDRFIQARERRFPLTFYLSDPARARAALQSLNGSAAGGGAV